MAGGTLMTLMAKIGLDDKEYKSGLQKAGGAAKSFGNVAKTGFKVAATAMAAVTGAAVALGTTLWKGINATAEYGDNVDKMSQKIGLSTDAYQKWDYVLKLAGTDINNMTAGIKTLTNKVDAAKEGNAGAIDSFQKLGISLEDLNKMSREEVFEAAIKGFQGMADSTDRAALANEIFGRSAAELTPLFNQTAESTDELIKKAEDYGMIMPEAAVKASAAFEDSLTTLQMTFTGLKNRLMGDFLPGVTKITDGLALMFTSDGLEEGAEQLNEGISETITNLTNLVSKVMEVGAPILLTLAQSLVDNAPTLLNEGIIPALQTLGSGLLEMLPQLLEFLTELLTSVAESLPDIIQTILESGVLETLLNAGVEILLALVQGITDSINDGGLIDTAVTVITSLVDGLIENLPAIISAATDLITALALALTEPDTLVSLVSAALELILALADGLIEALPQLIAQVPVIMQNLWQAIIQLLPMIKQAGNELLVKLGQGILSALGALLGVWAQIGSSIWNAVSGVVQKALNWGKDLIGNFISGIKAKWESAKATLEGIANFISGLFHHTTPDFGPLKDDDKWFSDMMDNFINGINKKMPELRSTLDGVAGEISGTLTAQASVDADSGIGGYTVIQNNHYINPHSDYEMWQSNNNLRRMVGDVVRGAV